MNFLKSEAGAVTIDWVVLTAGLIGLGIVVASVITPGFQRAANGIGEDVCKASGGTWVDATFSDNGAIKTDPTCS